MSTSPVPLTNVIFRKEDFEDPSLTLFNQELNNMRTLINSLAGFAGPIRLNNHLDLQGNRVTQVGEAQAPTDAVSQAFGAVNYGPGAIQPQLDALGNKVLQSTRRINDRTQSEKYSTFLNGVLNTAPTTNTSQVFFNPPSGGAVTLTISAGSHQRVDASEVPYAAFVDTVSLPTSYALTSLTRVGGIVTAVTTVANPFIAGETVTIPIPGLTDAGFAGSFRIQTIVNAFTFKYVQNAPDGASTGGTVSLGSVYYYFIQRGTNTLSRSGPFAEDSWSNRREANRDGQTIVAVAVVNAGGGDNANSAAGATPPSQNNGAGVRLFGRL